MCMQPMTSREFEFMKTTRPLFLVGALLAVASTPAAADVFDGNFSGDIFADWHAEGTYGRFTRSVGVTTTDYAALLRVTETAQQQSPAYLEGKLGISTGALSSIPLMSRPVEGSTLSQTFVAKAGDVVRFEYQYWNGEISDRGAALHDFSFVSLSSAGQPNVVQTLVDSSDRRIVPGAFSYLTETYAGQSAWLSGSVLVPTSGVWKLGFGLLEGGDHRYGAGLLIDSVRIVAAPVPEADVRVMLLAGLIALGGLTLNKQARG